MARKIKLNNSKGLPKIVKITPKMADKWGTKVGDTVVVPSLIEVDEIMKKVPKGKLITINEIRVALAKKHRATICCPMTTGIFACIVSKAAEESAVKGKKNIAPY